MWSRVGLPAAVKLREQQGGQACMRTTRPSPPGKAESATGTGRLTPEVPSAVAVVGHLAGQDPKAPRTALVRSSGCRPQLSEI